MKSNIMKSKYIILIIGILSIVASIYMVVNVQSITSTITGFICGISLLYSSYELSKQQMNNEES